MRDYLQKYGKNSLIISAVLILVSAFLIARPETAMGAIILTFGWVLILNGVFHLFSYFKSPSEIRMFNFEMTQGIISMIVGMLIILNGNVVATFLPVFLGIWVIAGSVFKFQIAINLSTIKDSNWLSMLVISVLKLVLGMFILTNPNMFGQALIVSVGVIILVVEIINIIEYVVVFANLKKTKTKTEPKKTTEPKKVTAKKITTPKKTVAAKKEEK